MVFFSSRCCLADWWALGVTCYEFLTGYPPFHDPEDRERIFQNMLNRNIRWEENGIRIEGEAKDFIDRLLDHNPKTRLGANGRFPFSPSIPTPRTPFYRILILGTLVFSVWYNRVLVSCRGFTFLPLLSLSAVSQNWTLQECWPLN